MAVVKYKTKLSKPRRGLCSTWLSSLDANIEHHIPIWVTKGTISPPRDIHAPMIMVGPGKYNVIVVVRAYMEQEVISVLFFV